MGEELAAAELPDIEKRQEAGGRLLQNVDETGSVGPGAGSVGDKPRVDGQWLHDAVHGGQADWAGHSESGRWRPCWLRGQLRQEICMRAS